MAASNKALVVFAVLLAAAFLVASAEETQSKKEEAKVGVQDDWRGGGYPGGGWRGGGGYPGRGGGYPGHGGGYPGHGGGYCRWGCCGRGYNGCRCCATADEVPEATYRPAEGEVHN